MVRREIKNFELVTEGGRYPCRVPFSVNSVLSSVGADVSSVGSFVRLETEIYVDDVALAMKNFYLRLRGLHGSAEVFIGDKKIGDCDGKAPICNVNAAGKVEKGNNLLSIRFAVKTAEEIGFAGLSMPIEIVRFSNAMIERVSLTQQHEDSSVTIGIKLDLIGNPDSVRAVATLVSSAGQIYYAGLTKGKGSITVSDPLYWWPKGVGLQNLYRLTVNLYGESDVEDTAEIRIGLRRIRCAPSSDGSVLLVGDTRVLPMGAVYVADGDPDTAACDRRAEAYVTSASMAGFNCLVLPKDSPRPTERFYEMCDVHGIMVIEEHGALDKGELEALHAVSHHACLALIDLIGNNTEEAAAQLNKILPDIDISVQSKAQDYISAPSLPSMKTIRAVIPEGERSLFSHSIEAIAEGGAIRDMLLSVAERYPYPSDLSSFAYASALASANKVGESVKQNRLSEGKTGRAVFNRLGDNSLAISPSAIDHRARWKPLQYYCSRHFAPVKVYAELREGKVVFSASSCRRTDIEGVLEYRIADSSNVTVYKADTSVSLSAMSAGQIHSVDLNEYVKGHESEYYLEFCLKEGSFPLSKDVILFVPEKHFEFKKPKFKTVVTGEERRFSVTVSSDVFVKDLELDFDGVDAVFSNNYIDLTTDAPVKIDVTLTGSAETTYRLKDALMIRSVYDLK